MPNLIKTRDLHVKIANETRRFLANHPEDAYELAIILTHKLAFRMSLTELRYWLYSIAKNGPLHTDEEPF